MPIILLRTCHVQHWFGIERAGKEQRLLAQLEIAKPTDALPAIIQCGNSWSDSSIQSAISATPACAPVFYYLFQMFGDQTAIRWEMLQAHGPKCTLTPFKHHYQDLVTDPAASARPMAAQPATLVLLRTLTLAAKLLSLIPYKSSMSLEVENLLCDSLTDVSLKLGNNPDLMKLPHLPSALGEDPAGGLSQDEQLCKVLVRILLPMLQESCKPRARDCHIRQGRAMSACKALIPLLETRQDISAAVADKLLLYGMRS